MDTDLREAPFLETLRGRIAAGGYATDDALACVLPLFRETLEAHEAGRVAPLDGVGALRTGGHAIWFQKAQQAEPKDSLRAVDRLDRPASRALDILGERKHTVDVAEGSPVVVNLDVGKPGDEVTRPVYLPGYRSWEHAVGHHDALTDTFSLGMILGSVALGLDFTERDDVVRFAESRGNLFALKPDLNPVVAKAIVRMTEISRHRRAQDLAAILRRLERYREQEEDRDFDPSSIRGFVDLDTGGKRRAVLGRLRQRLFEISRRNRLLYFRSSLQSLNLTFASVPLTFDVAAIRPEQLFTWHAEVERRVSEGKPVPLGKYLRFEDAPYVPDALDKLIREARRDQKEYGFAQLRLVVAFLRWHNLKEAPGERIDSPLLLLPVRLTKKKGVRDSYVLEPSEPVAEVNPVLRYQLKQLYDIGLPVSINLEETTVGRFYDFLNEQIQASEPGVTLRKVDRPQVRMVYDRARRRLDQYQRRLRLSGRGVRSFGDLDYSYSRENFQPLGLRLFQVKVKAAPAPLRDYVEIRPSRWFAAGEGDDGPSVDKERRVAEFQEGGDTNPYAWDFDLCSLTLGNFRYRKMSLVRDYETLLQKEIPNAPFDSVFSLVPRPAEADAPAPVPLEEQLPVVACDPTQASAIALARTGRSFIIQGPPGTGKSQTITNLIADFVARGKRVLFVCEKRAALDVVYHRLRQHGLDELCSLIHDSQTDKKEFILDLKKTYEACLAGGGEGGDPESRRKGRVRSMGNEMAPLRRFDEVMKDTPESAGTAVSRLLQRRVELTDRVPGMSELERERVPPYGQWERNRAGIERVEAAVRDLQPDGVLSHHPLCRLDPSVARQERPLETVMTRLKEARAAFDDLERRLGACGVEPEDRSTSARVRSLVDYALGVRRVAERGLMPILDRHHERSRAFARDTAAQKERREALAAAKEKTGGWKQRLPADELATALEQARRFERSWFAWLSPAWWRLRKVLNESYDFASHRIRPGWASILHLLDAEYKAAAVFERGEKEFKTAYGAEEGAEAFAAYVDAARNRAERAEGHVRALHARLLREADAGRAVAALADLHGGLERLERALDGLLADCGALPFENLRSQFERIESSLDDLPGFLSCLSELSGLPASLSSYLREAPLTLGQVEGAMADRTVRDVMRSDPFLAGFGGGARDRHVRRLENHYVAWLEGNAECVRDRVGRAFRTNVSISQLPAGQLNPEQKEFKAAYSAGRRILEHEFGKSMRYKSIRELLARESGTVILDLKPVWLMSPLSVSDTLPIDVNRFDVVLFDEASQIPLEDAVPSVFRAGQIIVVGDEMQLPPTNFFSAKRPEEEELLLEEGEEVVEYDLDSSSFLNHSCRNLPSTLLGWHYRSRSEALIGFSNAAFYGGELLTVPDRRYAGAERDAIEAASAAEGGANAERLLRRSLSFHFIRGGVYESRRNAAEAAYIAQTVRAILRRKEGLSIGIIAFSEAQQDEIEGALETLAKEDREFRELLDVELEREEDGQFCGLLVKNLENIQGDERDLVILSICYGPGPDGRMLMNFGPINQSGGEKRLNVAFSRARRHMAVVSSIRYSDIRNVYNDGANCLRNYLQYAESFSSGDAGAAERILRSGMGRREAEDDEYRAEAVVDRLAAALRARGFEVETGVGQSRFRCDLAVRRPEDAFHRAAVLVDTPDHYRRGDLLERELLKPRVLRAFDWTVCRVLTRDWIEDPEGVLRRIEKAVAGEADPAEEEIPEEETFPEEEPPPERGTETAVFEMEPRPPGRKRTFEFVGGGSSKFWEVWATGTDVTVRFGRIGTNGQTRTKTYPDEAAAARAAEKMVREKTGKGYRERTAPP